jgi:ribonuclease BN (tRNA processing enzyme)
MDICILGAHNCESRMTSCVSFIIDNTLAIDAGGLTSNLSIPDQEKLEAILLTHQHFDHIRDIPVIALNLSQRGASINVYATADVRDVIETHLLNGTVFPKFQELPESKPTVRFNVVAPFEPRNIDGHKILPVPVNHSVTTVGYEVSDKQGKSVFYTADTGPGLLACWKRISPHLLIADVTLPDACEEFARKTGHLTPRLLKEELVVFQESKGYLPQVVAIHMDTGREKEIKKEIESVAESLNIPITMAREGMNLHI